jgi:hypothetical protein
MRLLPTFISPNIQSSHFPKSMQFRQSLPPIKNDGTLSGCHHPPSIMQLVEWVC